MGRGAVGLSWLAACPSPLVSCGSLILHAVVSSHALSVWMFSLVPGNCGQRWQKCWRARANTTWGPWRTEPVIWQSRSAAICGAVVSEMLCVVPTEHFGSQLLWIGLRKPVNDGAEKNPKPETSKRPTCAGTLGPVPSSFLCILSHRGCGQKIEDKRLIGPLCMQLSMPRWLNVERNIVCVYYCYKVCTTFCIAAKTRASWTWCKDRVDSFHARFYGPRILIRLLSVQKAMCRRDEGRKSSGDRPTFVTWHI